jgi:ABC-type molybdate transport system ATPase subunit
MEGTQTINPRDILSYLGRDYVVEGVLSYQIPGHAFRLARVVDGDVVLWVELLTDAADDRLLVLTEVHDVAISTPPPHSISYRNNMFVQRFSGNARLSVAGIVAGRTEAAVDVWRYRAAGDLYLQIESSPGGHTVLYGESVHKGMIDVLPGK